MLKSARDSDLKDRKQRILCFLFAGFFLFFPKESLSLQIAPQPSIARVLVRVDGRPGEKDIRELVGIKEGEPFSLKRISRSIRQLYQTGLFSDIQVLRTEGQNVELTFLLTRKLFVRKIEFEAGYHFSQKKLRESLFSLRPGSHYTEEKLGKAVEELKQALEQEGLFAPQIRSFTEKDPQSTAVDVRFEISAGRTFILKKISFSPGELLIPETELKEKMKSKEERLYVPLRLEQDLTRLKGIYNALGYQRAEVELEEANFNQNAREVYLTLKVIPGEKIEILVKGAEVPLNLITPIWEERIFEEWGLAEGEARIVSYLRKKGFLFSRVKSSIEKAENKIRIVYEVNQGQKYKIQDISFDGLIYFKPDELKRQLGISEKIPFLGAIDGEKLFGLPREIEWLYQDQGFPNARVDLNFVQKEKKFKALYFIAEGPQQKIESISFGGASLFKPEDLLSRIKSYQGGPFSQPGIQRDIGELESFYLNQGVRGTKIEARIDKKGENLFSVVFDVNEGTKTKIDKVIITGNDVTRRSTILRELKIKEGDDADYDLILETKRGLEKLGIFSEVRIDEILMSEGKENIVISLKEGERNYAGLGVGLETKNEPRTFEVWNNIIRPRATAEFIRSNLFGQASQLSFVTQFSLKEKRGVLSWEQPYFFGVPLQSYLNAWLEREERKSFGYDQRGVSLTGIKSLSKNILLLSTLRWTRTKLYFLEISESEVDRIYFPFSATSLSGSFIRDQRDDTFNPEKGYFLSAVAEWAFPLFKAESNFLKAFFKYQHYVPLFSGINFSITSRLGLGRGRMPIHERFFGGGSNSFRGDEFDELGPKDTYSQKPVGGKALVLFNFELKFPLSSALQNLSGAIFYDVGNIFAKRKDLDLLGLRHALGFGVRYKTPLGPLRFDLAWNLNAPERKGKPLAFITIGNVF